MAFVLHLGDFLRQEMVAAKQTDRSKGQLLIPQASKFLIFDSAAWGRNRSSAKQIIFMYRQCKYIHMNYEVNFYL